MILRAGVVAVALVSFLAAVPTASAARCNPSKSRTIVDDGDARVYKDRRAHRIEGCLRSVGTRVTLGRDSYDGLEAYFVNRVRLAAPYVAAVEGCGCRDYNRGPGMPRLTVRDLRDGRTVSRVIRPPEFPGFTDVVLANDGAAAFISSGDDGIKVSRLGPGGEPQTVDSGRNIDPRSLVLGGDGTMYWRHGDTVLSASLRG